MRSGLWMRSWVEKLRWGLLAGGLSLLLLLAAVLGYSRYQALRTWHRILQRSGATLTRETNGFTYSQSVAGHTVFTLHAAKAVQAKDGKYALHDVSLLLYRQAEGQPDRVYGSEFEYDQKTGVARALGPVHMDLQAPRGMSLPKLGSASPPPVGTATNAGKGPHSPGAEASETDLENDSGTIHVKTSGLVYVRNLGVAATDQDVEFRYGTLECHARGAEFNSGQSTVHLLAEVRVNGAVRGKALNLTASRVDLDRQTNIAQLQNPEVRTDGKTARAANTVLHLRPDGSLQTAEATGAVRLDRGTQTVTANRADVRVATGSVMQDLVLTGDVGLSDADRDRPLQAHAGSVHASFDAHGSTRDVQAEGSTSLVFFEHGQLRREVRGARMNARFLPGGGKHKALLQVVRISGRAHAAEESRAEPELKPQRAGIGSGLLPAASLQVVAVKTQRRAGNSVPQAGAAGAGAANVSRGLTSLDAGELVVTMEAGTDGKPEPRLVEGTGDTVLEQTLPHGVSRRSTGDRLTLRLGRARTGETLGSATKDAAGSTVPGRPAAFEVLSATQQGAFTLRSVAVSPAKVAGAEARQTVTTGSAQRADFTEATHQVRLSGQAHLRNDDGELSAAAVDLDTVSGALGAQGQVMATLTQAGKPAGAGAPGPASRATPLHVAAASARFVNDSGVAEFHGSDTQPVRLWQGGSQLEAATVVLDRGRNLLTARPAVAGGLVRSVFAAESEASGAKTHSGSGAPSGVLRVTSARLDYNGGSHEADFAGGVRTVGTVGEVHSQTAVVFLKGDGGPGRAGTKSGAGKSGVPGQAGSPDLLGGAVEKVVLSGKVQLEQPGRVGTGEQLLYTAADASFVLTGTATKPPHIVDAQQGSLTGTTLLFRTGDNTVVVASDPAHTGASHGRVRTELNLRP